jgi:hypothetical protein
MSDTVTWKQFTPLILPEVKGCAPNLAIQAVRDTAIDFCATTWVWVEVHDPYTLSPGEVFVDFEADEDARVEKILYAKCDDTKRELIACTPEFADERFPNWMSGGQAQHPQYLVQLGSTQFVPVPTTDVQRTVTLRAAHKPSRTSQSGPVFLLDDHQDAIVLGAKARLWLMSAVPWANPQLGAAAMTAYTAMKDAAQAKAQRGFGRARRHVKGQYL